MTWEYRVRNWFQSTNVPGAEAEEIFDIIEVYYDDVYNIEAWCEAAGPMGNTQRELRRDIDLRLHALDKPILTDDDLPGDDR